MIKFGDYCSPWTMTSWNGICICSPHGQSLTSPKHHEILLASTLPHNSVTCALENKLHWTKFSLLRSWYNFCISAICTVLTHTLIQGSYCIHVLWEVSRSIRSLLSQYAVYSVSALALLRTMLCCNTILHLRWHRLFSCGNHAIRGEWEPTKPWQLELCTFGLTFCQYSIQ